MHCEETWEEDGHLRVKQRGLEHILPLELSERTNADEAVNLDFQPVEL